VDKNQTTRHHLLLFKPSIIYKSSVDVHLLLA